MLYWHDPMVPGHRFDKPGKSPFMDMQLVPVYADEAQGPGVSVNPAMAQNLGMRTALVRKAPAASSVEAVGTVMQNERATVVVQSRVSGYVEKLFVRATLDPVAEGPAAGDDLRARMVGRIVRVPGASQGEHRSRDRVGGARTAAPAVHPGRRRRAIGCAKAWRNPGSR